MTNEEVIRAIRTTVLTVFAIALFLASCMPLDKDEYVQERVSQTEQEAREDLDHARTTALVFSVVLGLLAVAPTLSKNFYIRKRKP